MEIVEKTKKIRWRDKETNLFYVDYDVKAGPLLENLVSTVELLVHCFVSGSNKQR